MYCMECGAQIAAEAKFCDKCGASQAIGEQPALTNAASVGTRKAVPKLAKWIYGVVGVVVVLIAAGAFVLNGGQLATNTTQNQQKVAGGGVPAAGSLNIILAKRNEQSGDICEWYWEAKNNTELNFSNLVVDFVMRDSSSNVVQKDSFSGRAAPNGTLVAHRMFENCASVKFIDYVGINGATQVDGEYISGYGTDKKWEQRVRSISVKSASNVDGITTKSSGGTFVGISSEAKGTGATKSDSSSEDRSVDARSSLPPVVITDSSQIEAVCEKLSGMTKGLTELSASYWETSTRNIGFLKAYIRRDGGCRITVDTPKGPQDCIVLAVVSANGKYLAHIGQQQMSMVCGM